MKNDEKITPQLFETYIAVIKNSIGTKMFKNFYAKIGNKKIDIMRNGDLSCAFFVTSVLVLFKLIKSGHATIASTIKDLKESGWITIEKPKPGSIIIWEELSFSNGESNKHIGFYISPDEVVSTNSKTGKVYKHHPTYKDTRKIETIFWNNKLN